MKTLSLTPSHSTGGAERARFTHAVGAGALCASLLVACTLDTAPRASDSSAATAETDARPSALQEPAAGSGSSPAVSATAPTQAHQVAAPAVQATDAAAAEDETVLPAEAPNDKDTTPEVENGSNTSEIMPPAEDNADATTDTRDTRCRPGKYTGVISGTVNLTGILAVSTLAGTIDMELVADPQRTDVLLVQNGRVEGVDDSENRFSADLTGAVSCASGQILESAVERGMFQDPMLDAELRFAGEAKGQYTMDPPALVGTWAVSDETALLAGQGTWSTSLSESASEVD
jgi:hypothetical protein